MPEPVALEVLDEGYWCIICEWFEGPESLTDPEGREDCSGCGCLRSHHVTARVVTEGVRA